MDLPPDLLMKLFGDLPGDLVKYPGVEFLADLGRDSQVGVNRFHIGHVVGRFTMMGLWTSVRSSGLTCRGNCSQTRPETCLLIWR
jgi:hypothetical protein